LQFSKIHGSAACLLYAFLFRFDRFSSPKSNLSIIPLFFIRCFLAFLAFTSATKIRSLTLDFTFAIHHFLCLQMSAGLASNPKPYATPPFFQHALEFTLGSSLTEIFCPKADFFAAVR
jgi:hypothetical protein